MIDTGSEKNLFTRFTSKAKDFFSKEEPAKKTTHLDGERIFYIDGVRTKEKNFPNTEMIEKQEERPTKLRIPPDMALSSADQPIWLTTEEAKRRLKTLLHTHTEFNRVPQSIGRIDRVQHDIPMMAEAGFREGCPPEEMIEKLKKRGFPFVEYQDKTVMLIDATIPFKDDVTSETITTEGKQMFDAVTGASFTKAQVIPQEKHKLGIRPANEKSAYALGISVEELVKIHKESTGISTITIGGASDHDVSPGLSSRFIEGMNWTMLNIVGVTLFKHLKANEQLGNKIEILKNKFDKKSLKGKDRLEMKSEFFELLEKDFNLSSSIGGGKFPYEPRYKFNLDKGDQPSLKLLETTETDNFFSTIDFRLEDMIEIVKQVFEEVQKNDELPKKLHWTI